MAFDDANLHPLATRKGHTVWRYDTPDLATDVDTTDYFLDAVSKVGLRDFIQANTNSGGTNSSGMFIVVANSGASIDTANLSSFGLANAD